MQKTQKKILSFLHKCAINEDQMMHGSWDLKCKGQSFWVLPLLTTQKIKIFEKQKKHLKILPFYFSGTKNHDHILYFLPLPLTTLGIRILKKWKKKTPGDVIILHKWNQISGSYAILFLRYGMWQM